MTAALWGSGSGAPVTLAGLGVLAVLVVVAVLVHRYRPDLVERLDEWLDHLLGCRPGE